jgi:hypothetical protein
MLGIQEIDNVRECWKTYELAVVQGFSRECVEAMEEGVVDVVDVLARNSEDNPNST